MKIASSLNSPGVGALAVLALLGARLGYFYSATDDVLIAAIADDAFYYMEMARHRSEDGFWTFDGTSPATGFHFLYGYFLVTTYTLFGDVDWRELFLFVGALSSIFISISAYLIASSATRIFGREFALLACLPFLTFPSLALGTVMMESWLVLLFSAATIYYMTLDRRVSLLGGVALLSVGMLGSMSRTDFGMLPGVMFLLYLLSFRIYKGRELRRSFLLLVGAIFGLAVVLTQNLAISGQLSQASAQTKFYWSSALGHNASPAISLAEAVALPFVEWIGDPDEAMVLTIVLLGLGYAYYSFRSKRKDGSETGRFYASFLMVVGCLSVIVGYIAFYRHNSQALQIWYSANFIAPAGMALSGMAFLLIRKRRVVATAAGIAVYGITGLSSVFAAPWPHQAGMMRAGLFLRDYEPGATYAAWNAGILGYFSRVGVINIDGLTNDEVLPFIKQNRLLDYLAARGVNYVIDYEVMLHDPKRRVRGGYDSDRFDRCVQPIESIDGDSPGFAGSELKIFRVVLECI
jgi:hypothetical protein